EEQLKRKAAKDALRQAERDRIKASLPIPLTKMKALFDFVDQRLSDSECNHTLRHTIEYLDGQQIPHEPVLSWLEDAGGYCDCEVIANAEEKLESILPD
ncbi:MAG TPA: DUF2695 domain-containing protein, partial [Terriglobales bacterium]|nr:DUF2695 domain-containing protein [Terriglobales bacterium]